MSNPLYKVNDVVYLKEAAASGLLESYNIAAVSSKSDGVGWMYALTMRRASDHQPATIGERISYQSERFLYFEESELITICVALELVETNLTQRLVVVEQLKTAYNC